MAGEGPSKLRVVNAIAVIVALFGILTLISGGLTLFVDGAARASAGDYVGFVLWFNFLAGFAYLVAGVGLFLWRGWGTKLSMGIAVATLLVFAAFGIHILLGGSFEPRTIGAMVLRSGVWTGIAAGAYFAGQQKAEQWP